tara:strand:- start:4089 stop:5516 length:1428 start_codon:yes stop_codon:yes gene_type:complete
MINRNIPFLVALLPMLVLIILLSYNVFLYGDNSLNGANQLVLLFAAATAVFIGKIYGSSWKVIVSGISKSIASASPAIIILLLIGALAGTWLISGIIPAMIYFGLQILNPKIFLFVTAIITAIVSLSTGSSWGTVATIGIALLGIGQALGLPTGYIGGAIISGAYFGDKMSPLSDTTNLAPAMVDVDIFRHIRYMMYTTIPSFVITLIIFLIIGFTYKINGQQDINELLSAISNSFNINLWVFLVPITVLILIINKLPAIPSLFIGVILGGLFAIISQPQLIMTLTDTDKLEFSNAYIAIINAMASDTSITTNNENISNLLTTSGMAGMLNTIWLIICAMVFGGAMESTGLLNRLAQPVIRYAKDTGSLVATTVVTCLFFNITASDQYLSIVVPGRMFRNTYKDKGLAPVNLSRTLEDSGTVTSVLIPWNTCGATQSAVLGVATFTYLPYCFFNIISPLMTIIYAYMGIKIEKIK